MQHFAEHSTGLDFFRRLPYLLEHRSDDYLKSDASAMHCDYGTDYPQSDALYANRIRAELDAELQAYEWRLAEQMIQQQLEAQLEDVQILGSDSSDSLDSPTTVLSPTESFEFGKVDSPVHSPFLSPIESPVHNPVDLEQKLSEKLCRKCNQYKPLDDFYKSKASADGRDGRCKECDAVHCRKRREKIPRVEKPTVERKCCKRCHILKSAKDFYRYTTNSDGLHNYCKACFKKDAARRRSRWHELPANMTSGSIFDKSLQFFDEALLREGDLLVKEDGWSDGSVNTL